MNKLLVIVLILFLITGTAFAKGNEIKTRVGEYEAELRLDRSPLAPGDNHIEIQVREAEGNPITEAKGLFSYALFTPILE